MADDKDILNFFDLFDKVLCYHKASLITVKPKGAKEGLVNKILLFKDLLTVEGNFKKPLFTFLTWLISDNGRELFLAKKCNIKFLHLQGKLSLLRVAVHIDSGCTVTSNSIDWVLSCLVSWKKHCIKSGSQAEINHAELMLASLGTDPIKPHASFILPPGIDVTTLDLSELENKGKDQNLVQKQLEERAELTETNIQISQDILHLNEQATQVEDRIIGRYVGLFAKIEGDLQLDTVKIESDLDQLQRFYDLSQRTTNIDAQAFDKEILDFIVVTYDEQNRVQKDIEKMKEYYSNLVKSKNSEMESLVRELAGKNHYMTSALSFNSSLAITKSALEEATAALVNPRKPIARSMSALPSPCSNSDLPPHPPQSSVQRTPSVSSPIKSPPTIKNSSSFFSMSMDNTASAAPKRAPILTTEELCDTYEIDSPCIFEGG